MRESRRCGEQEFDSEEGVKEVEAFPHAKGIDIEFVRDEELSERMADV